MSNSEELSKRFEDIIDAVKNVRKDLEDLAEEVRDLEIDDFDEDDENKYARQNDIDYLLDELDGCIDGLEDIEVSSGLDFSCISE